MNYAIKASNIEIEYNGRMLLDIDELFVYPTDKIGLVGANGRGKTTLLHILAGILPCPQAAIERNGIIRVMEQLHSTEEYEELDVDNDLLKNFSKLSVADKSREHFSGGEETRTQIANTFRADTAGIIADEPTSHLDYEGIQYLIAELKTNVLQSVCGRKG
ncbi:MAG: ATP-binding cassette domain-containing protein [Lachnospiraceae bacterium]|nr:ATP-binding cassette domain-containing protein [Lachnospiraceae bacterium]